MYIRRYGQLPGFFVPDEGEVVLAARSISGPYTRAVVTKVRRTLRDAVRIDFVWLEASTGGTARTDGYKPGEKGHVKVSTAGDGAALIRRISGTPSPPQGE